MVNSWVGFDLIGGGGFYKNNFIAVENEDFSEKPYFYELYVEREGETRLDAEMVFPKIDLARELLSVIKQFAVEVEVVFMFTLPVGSYPDKFL